MIVNQILPGTCHYIGNNDEYDYKNNIRIESTDSVILKFSHVDDKNSYELIAKSLDDVVQECEDNVCNDVTNYFICTLKHADYEESYFIDNNTLLYALGYI